MVTLTLNLMTAATLLALGDDAVPVVSQQHTTRNQAARIGDEGPLRYAEPDFAVNHVLPPLAPAASSGVTQGVVYDATTGEQTVLDVAASTDLARWVGGFSDPELAAGEGATYAGWTSDLTPITPTSFPWTAQVRVLGRDASGASFEYSGTLIDARHVITAAHCVHAGSGGTWHNSITVHPAWDGDDDAFGNAFGTHYATFTAWTGSSDPNNDVGFIRLDRPIGFLTNWFGYGFDTNDSFYTANYFNLAGFPAAGSCYLSAPDQMYYGFGLYDAVTSGQLTGAAAWSCDGFGMDGGGGYTIISGERFIHAVHRDHDFVNDQVMHTRLTSTHTSFYEGSVHGPAYSTTVPDYVPLDVQVDTGGGPIRAGDPVVSMDYLVGNNSLFDPTVTQTHSVRVYLSSNNNISEFDTLIQTHTYDFDFDPLGTTRVTVAQPPIIPADTPSGTYWIGIITESFDGDSSNNDTDGRDAFEITVEGCSVNFTAFGVGLPGSAGFAPVLYGTGSSCLGGGHSINVAGGLGGTLGNLWVSLGQTDIFPAFGGGHFYIDLTMTSNSIGIFTQGPSGVPGAGYLNLTGSDIRHLAGITVYLQVTLLDAAAIGGVSMTNGLSLQLTP